MHFLPGTCLLLRVCGVKPAHLDATWEQGGRERQSQKYSELTSECSWHLKKKNTFFNKPLLTFDNSHMTGFSNIYIACPHLGQIKHYRQNSFSIDCPHLGQVSFYIFHIIPGIQQLLPAVDVCFIFGCQELSYLSEKTCTSKQQCCVATGIQRVEKFCGLNNEWIPSLIIVTNWHQLDILPS